MLSLASLLNPVMSEHPGTSPSSPPSSLCTSSPRDSPMLISSSIKKQKMTKDGAVFAKGKIKGDINFPPFERFSEETTRDIQRFQVYPVGNVQDYPRHIPYNSEKKSFLEKTGRESFEVFQYIFKLPGDDKEYTVMWDYNIGLVRITPFFKCCKYSKTTPAKMLNLNPGLKEISHSITGGALAAQGYWMPYACALAICTTFCAHIAPALIPIFGPNFPSQCVSPEAPEHGRMVIDPSIVAQATAEANAFRLQHTNSSYTPKSTPRDSYSPQQSVASDSISTSANLNINMQMGVRRDMTMGTNTHRDADMRELATPPTLSRRLRLRRAHGENPYGTPSDTDAENGSETSSTDGYFCSPGTPSSLPAPQWAPRNQISHSANSSINLSPAKSAAPSPWLSAIPRSTGLVDVSMDVPWRGKRRAEDLDADDEYEGDSCADEKGSAGERDSVQSLEEQLGLESSTGGVEKKAAWLLMNLSVRDGEGGAESAREIIRDEKDFLEGPRVKRRRATSM